MISSVPISRSHSKRSRLISSGRMATAVQPSSAQSKAPPRQKLPVEGQTAFCVVGVELAGDQPRHQAAEAGADLVRAGREVLADQADDARRHAGQLGRELDPVAVG